MKLTLILFVVIIKICVCVPRIHTHGSSSEVSERDEVKSLLTEKRTPPLNEMNSERKTGDSGEVALMQFSAFAGDGCPTGLIRIGRRCIAIDF
ncbi:unnamed protein product [Pieris macdunnoughi]|uniref:Uncharacterized protein n=1 Tax=Pieris macdunnoughi TaxID=345717 RepID=A0A821SLB0_9NEOP|nr:unnamed protein product [Pieris macdunnoughi]